jgi:hypothetical protein
MSKPFDFYAGYPNQQRAPKWVGITLGSVFGALTIFMAVVAIRMLMPQRSAEASMAPKAASVASAETTPGTAPVVAPTGAPSEPVVATAKAAADLAAVEPGSRLHKKNKKGKHGHLVAKLNRRMSAAPANPRYKKAQMYAKGVSASSHRDKRARDEMDKMLGL